MQIKIKTYKGNTNMGNKISLAFLTIILFLTLFVSSCSKKNDISIQQLPQKDTTVKSVNNDSSNIIKLSYEQEQGSFLFHKYCAVCHGETGKGNGFNSYNLNPRPRNFSDSVFAASMNLDNLQLAISRGGNSIGKSALMHPYDNTLKSHEIEYLAQYILVLRTYKK